MPFDILLIIDQLKKFWKLEKGTLVALLATFFIELIVYNFIFGLISKYIIFDYLKIYFIIVLITTFAWCISRRLGISKRKTNIGITNFSIVDINLTSIIAGEVRYNISEELDEYIAQRLLSDDVQVDVDKNLNIVLLPHRSQLIDNLHIDIVNINF